jgi:hypothetical protein
MYLLRTVYCIHTFHLTKISLWLFDWLWNHGAFPFALTSASATNSGHSWLNDTKSRALRFLSNKMPRRGDFESCEIHGASRSQSRIRNFTRGQLSWGTVLHFGSTRNWWISPTEGSSLMSNAFLLSGSYFNVPHRNNANMSSSIFVSRILVAGWYYWTFV